MPHHRIIWLPLLAIGCASGDPLRDIPAADRAMLQAEARLAAPTERRSTVAAMLERARGPGAAPLLLRFQGDTTQPDPAQREAILRFAAATSGTQRLVVTSRREPEAGVTMLGPRRAIAVARVLEAEGREAEIRFDATMAADTVRIVQPPVALP